MKKSDIKKNRFIQHIPHFVETVRVEFDFYRTEELLNHPAVLRVKDAFGDSHVFHRFVMSISCTGKGVLIAEFDDGKKWWVIGQIEHPELVELPEWSMTKAENFIKEREWLAD